VAQNGTPSVHSDTSKHIQGRLVALSIIIATILGILSDLIAAYIQDHFNILNSQARFGIVLAVFISSLSIGVWLAIKQIREPSE
jgi:hypothetical protein